MTTELARRAGTALAWRGVALGGEKLIFLLRLVVLARLLTPQEFGLAAIGMTAVAIALSATDFGVVAALIREPAADRRHRDTAWTLSVLRGVAIVTVLALAAPWIANLFAEPRATDIIRVIAITALLRAASSIEIARLNRELRFGGLVSMRLASAITNTVVAIVLAPAHGVWAIVWGAVAGEFVYFLTSYVVAPYRPAVAIAGRAAVGIARFGRWIFLTGILGVAFDAILRWLVATRLGVAELGLLFMAIRLAFLPVQLISEIVGEVAFPVYATLRENRAKAGLTFRGLLVSVSALLLPTAVVFAVLVPGLVEHVLGQRWEGTVVVLQLLILSSVVGLIGDAVTPALKGSGSPAGIALMDALQLAVIAVLGWLLIGTWGLVGAGIAWFVAVLLSQFLAVGYAHQLFDRPFSGMIRALAAIATATSAAALTAAATSSALTGPAGLIAAALAAGGVAAVLMLLLDRRLKLGIVATLGQAFPWLHRFVSSPHTREAGS